MFVPWCVGLGKCPYAINRPNQHYTIPQHKLCYHGIRIRKVDLILLFMQRHRRDSYPPSAVVPLLLQQQTQP